MISVFAIRQKVSEVRFLSSFMIESVVIIIQSCDELNTKFKQTERDNKTSILL